MILTLKTDADVAQMALYAKGVNTPTQQDNIELGRAMARDLLTHLEAHLQKAGITWHSLTGIVVFQGPGSFTGLRIGATVANTIAYAEAIPIVGEQGSNWAARGLKRLRKGENDRLVLPRYGREATITQPRK